MTVADRFAGVRSGLGLKAPCRVATTANITLAGEQTIDDVAVLAENAAGLPDRVLVKDQNTTADNGIYLVSTGNWTRAKDFNGTGDAVKGTRIYVHSGTVGAGEFEITTADPITIGTTSLTFAVTAYTEYANLAEDWATKTDGQVASTDYSSKAWAVGGTGVTDTASRGSAKDWATKAEDSTVDGSSYSALHHSAKAAAQVTLATAQVALATAAQSAAETAETNAETAETNAETAQAAAEAARDAAFINANVYASTAAGLAGTAEGDQFHVVEGDEIVRYSHDAGPVATEVASILSAAGSQQVGGRNVASFPRDRRQYGIIAHPSPNVMTSNSAEVTEWGRFEIPAGIGEDYRAVVSTHASFSEAGSRALFFLTVDAGSGSHSDPAIQFISATLGTENLTFTEEISGLWVIEQTVPASGYSSVVCTLTSTDAGTAITGSLLHYCVSPVGANGFAMQRDAQSVANWAMDDYREGPGNLWPIEKGTLSVAAADSLEAKRVNGITVDSADAVTVMIYAEASDGTPALVDRLYMRAVSETPSSSQNIFIDPVAGHPGVYAKTVNFNSLSGPSSYLELNVDNAQASAFYTESAVEVQAIQAYKRPPASFYPPSLLTYNASDGLFASNFDGLLDVYTPMNSPTGDEYIQWQTRRYDTTGNPAGGGVGSVLEALYYCRRSANYFAPVYKLTDTGLNEFALKKDDGTNEHAGHDVHGGQARRASPSFKIDDVSKTDTARADYRCDKVEWIEYTELYDRLDGTTVIANLDTTKTWEGDTFKLLQEIEFLQDIDLLTLYMFLFSPYASVDNDSGIGAMFDAIAMPNQADALYTPGGGVNDTYPSETRFVATGPLGWTFDIAVQGSPLAAFRSWVQSGSGSRKFYMSATGVGDSFGILAERVAYPVLTGATFSLETWITVTK